MYCPNCGAQLPDGAKFCASCGAKVTPPEPTTQYTPITTPGGASPTPIPTDTSTSPEAQAPHGHKGKLPLIIGGVAAVAVVAVVLVVFVFGGGTGGKRGSSPSSSHSSSSSSPISLPGGPKTDPNQSANMANYGAATSTGDKIYYAQYDFDTSVYTISSVDKDGSNHELLLSAPSGTQYQDLVLADDTLFYVVIDHDNETQSVCSIGTDGSDQKTIFTAQNNQYISALSAQEGIVYVLAVGYSSDNPQATIYSMDPDGGNQKKEGTINDLIADCNIDGDTVYYSTSQSSTNGYGIFSISVDGTNYKKICSADDYISNLQVYDGTIYYIVNSGNGQKACSVKTDGSDAQTLATAPDTSTFVSGLNATNQGVYWVECVYDDDYNGTNTIYKYDADSDQGQAIYTCGSDYNLSLCVCGKKLVVYQVSDAGADSPFLLDPDGSNDTSLS